MKKEYKTFETERLIVRPTTEIDAAINDFNISKISAITLKENLDSQNLLIKLGLQFEKNYKNTQ